MRCTCRIIYPLHCAREEEDADVRTKERRRKVPVELRPHNPAVAVNVCDRAPVLLSLGLLALDRAGDLLADVELRVLLAGDTLDLEERLGWVELALVAAERGEGSLDVELRLRHEQKGRGPAIQKDVRREK